MGYYRASMAFSTRRRRGGLLYIAPVNEANFSALSYTTVPAWVDYSGIVGNRMVTDSTGKITWALSNMLLNSATLSTQNVTTLAQNYILSFKGTGSITCSGTSTTVLNGTGAATRVSSVLTTTAGTLTLTVSGTVTEAQLEPVTYETSPRDYIASGAAATYLPRFDYNAATSPATAIGILIEESIANKAIYSSTFSNAAWGAKTGLTLTGGQSSPDGVTGATLVQSTSAGTRQLVQAVTVTATTQHTASFFLKAGTTNFGMVRIIEGANSASWTFNLSTGVKGSNVISTISSTANMVDVGSGWYRCSVTATTTGTTISIAALPVNAANSGSSSVGNNITVWHGQLEANSFASSPIPTTTVAITRSSDIVQLSGTALTAINANTGSAIVQTYRISNVASVRDILSAATTRRLLYSNSSNTIVSSTDGTTRLDATIGSSGTFTGGVVRSGIGWSASGRSIAANSGVIASDTVNISTGTTATLGGYGTTVTFNGWVSSMAVYDQKLSDATLIYKTTVGAQY